MPIAAKVPKINCYLVKKIRINVENDEPHIHPNKFCQSCHTKAGQYSEAICSTLEVFEWTAHIDPSSHTYANMTNGIERLKSIVMEHYQQICPDNVSLQPPPVKIKKE